MLKTGDFGCALKCGDDAEKPLNCKVTTMWYRAPGMLLGSRSYDFAVDMWALGCVCVEMVGRAIAFPGIKEDDMLDCIFRLFGTPAPHRWASLTRLPYFKPNKFRSYTRSEMPWDLGSAHSFVGELLVPCPAQRLTSKKACQHLFLQMPTSGGHNND